jgi:hypothetical protein
MIALGVLSAARERGLRIPLPCHLRRHRLGAGRTPPDQRGRPTGPGTRRARRGGTRLPHRG